LSDNQAANETAKSGTSRLRIILFVLLGLSLVGAAYDFLWARKQHRAAATRIDELLALKATGETITTIEPTTADQVHKAMMCQPVQTIEEDAYLEERYSWRSGLPWRTHDIHVIYNYQQPRQVHDFSVGTKPAPSQYPVRPPAATPTTAEEAATIEAALKAAATARERANERK